MNFFGKPTPAGDHCASCPLRPQLGQLGIDIEGADRLIALAGNPNTGKSSVFNALTGLRQHVGNWPGKTVSRAEGAFDFGGYRYKIVDLPGTYSLLSASQDEEISRNFLLFGQPDVTIIVVDATALERNLNLALQVLEITERAVLCVNLMDEARRKNIEIDFSGLSRDLGIPAVPTVARTHEGLHHLLETVAAVIERKISLQPLRPKAPEQVESAVQELIPMIEALAPGVPNPRWIAYRLLDGDHRIRRAIETGELGHLHQEQQRTSARKNPLISLDGGQ